MIILTGLPSDYHWIILLFRKRRISTKWQQTIRSALMFVKAKDELFIIDILTILLIVIVVVLPSDILHVILGLPVALLFPGYALLAAQPETSRARDTPAISPKERPLRLIPRVTIRRRGCRPATPPPKRSSRRTPRGRPRPDDRGRSLRTPAASRWCG